MEASISPYRNNNVISKFKSFRHHHRIDGDGILAKIFNFLSRKTDSERRSEIFGKDPFK